MSKLTVRQARDMGVVFVQGDTIETDIGIYFVDWFKDNISNDVFLDAEIISFAWRPLTSTLHYTYPTIDHDTKPLFKPDLEVMIKMSNIDDIEVLDKEESEWKLKESELASAPLNTDISQKQIIGRLQAERDQLKERCSDLELQVDRLESDKNKMNKTRMKYRKLWEQRGKGMREKDAIITSRNDRIAELEKLNLSFAMKECAGQKAAKERKEAVKEIQSTMDFAGSDYYAAERLYDAGYRKQQ